MSGSESTACRERRDDDLAAYALGALAEPEAAELERHLETCPACAERLRWLQPAVDLVPASVPQVEPPPELRENLMAVVRGEAGAEEERAGRRADAAERAGRAGGLRARLRLPRLAAARPALAVLAVLAVLAAGVGGYVLGSDDSGSGSGVERFAVTPLEPGVPASGRLEVREGSATLTMRGLPPVGGDDVYQLWTVSGNERPRPASIFVPARGGEASAAIPDLPSGTDQVLVTREPAGGSEVPTSGPLLQSTLR